MAQLAVRVPVAAGSVVSLLVTACWTTVVGHGDGRCLLLDLRLVVRLGRSVQAAEYNNDGLPTSITTTNTLGYAGRHCVYSDAATQSRSSKQLEVKSSTIVQISGEYSL